MRQNSPHYAANNAPEAKKWEGSESQAPRQMADQHEVRAEVTGTKQNPIWTNKTLVFAMSALKIQCLYMKENEELERSRVLSNVSNRLLLSFRPSA